MIKLKYAVILLVLTGCGTSESGETEIEKTPQEKAVVLRDSAMVMAKAGKLALSIKLYDKALELDPKSKGILLSKLNTLYHNGDSTGVVEVLEVIDGSSIRDPYSTLHLGMEYELIGKKELAIAKYNEAVISFMAVLDTMPIKKELRRNTTLMNLALAAALSESEENQQNFDKVLTDAERENLAESLEALNNTSRDKLLQVRRKHKS